MKYFEKLFVLFSLWFVLSGTVLAVENVDSTRIAEAQKNIRNAWGKAAEEAEILESQAARIFASEKPGTEEKRNLQRDALEALRSLSLRERQPMMNYQSVSAPSRQFEVWARNPGSIPACESAQAFMTGPGDCVAVHSGEILLPVTDISAPTRGGIGFSFTRTYHSQVDYPGPMGNGWDHSQNLRIIADSEDWTTAKTLTLYDGSQTSVFSKDGENWLPESGCFLKLETEKDGEVLTITNEALTTFRFEKALKPGCWRIAKIVSRIGGGKNSLVYQYDARSGQLRSVTDPFGNQFRFSYTQDGRLAWVQGADQLVQFEYDFHGDLVKTRLPAVALSLKEKTDLVHEYRYENHRLVEFVPKNGGALTRFTFDGNRVVKAGNYAKNDGLTVEWKFTYEPGKTTVQPPAPFPVEVYEFDASIQNASLPIRKEIPAQKAVWKYQFNKDLLLTEVLSPEGQKKIQIFDSENPDTRFRQNVLQESTIGNGSGNGFLKEKGERTVYLAGTSFPLETVYYQIERDGKETILGRETFQYSEKEFLLTESNSFTVSTRFFYNPVGQIALKQFADGSCTIYRYDKNFPKAIDQFRFTPGSVLGEGLCVEVLEDADPQAVLSAARELGIEIQPASERAVNRKTQTVYNAQGDAVCEEVDGQLSLVWTNRNGDTILAYDSTDGLIISEYNSRFEKTHVFHPVSQTLLFKGESLSGFHCGFVKETFVYNDFGQVIQWSPTDEEVGTPKQKPVWKYERTPSGLLLAMTSPSGIRRVTTYDETGRQKEIHLENGSARTVLSSDYEYSPSGKVLSWRDNRHALWLSEYNELGESWKTTTPDGRTTFSESDGLGNAVSEQVFWGEELLSQNRTIYGENAQPVKTVETLIYNGKTEDFVTSETLYDAKGRAVSERTERENSWTTTLYDGLDRPIGTISPAGDISVTCYRAGKPIFQKQITRNEVDGTLHSLSTVQLFDEFETSWGTVPVDGEGNLVLDRAQFQQSDLAGNVVLTKSPGLASAISEFNSLSQNIRKRVIPANRTFGEQDVLTEFEYDLDGNLVSQTTHNQALAVWGSKEDASVRFEDAPQKDQFSFDRLGRVEEEIQPDGLRIFKTYNGSSLIQEIKWFGPSGKLLRHLEFHYDVMQRPTEIRDVLANKVVRTLEYDRIGNLAKVSDLTGDHEVVVTRDFDSWGIPRSETLQLDGQTLPEKHIEMDPVQGRQTLKWANFPHSTPYWSNWTLKTNEVGRFTRMALDYQDFCEWKYQGNQAVEREIPDSRMKLRRKINALGEVESIEIGNETNKTAPWIQIGYFYGKHGEVEAVTSRLRDVDGRIKAQTQYHQYDSFMNLTGTNQDAFTVSDPLERRNRLFNIGTQVVSSLSSQMRYDQAGNVWSNFSGMNSTSFLPGSIPAKRNPEYFSSASILPGNSGSPTEQQLCELASNRLTTIALPERPGSEKLHAKEYKYDELGCLIQYDGFFTGTEKRTPARWFLTYDVFGRLESMRACELKKKSDSGTEPEVGDEVAVLKFAYDSYNRRVLKEVKETSRNTSETTAVLYDRDHPALVFEKTSTDWRIQEQYLWGVDSQELLMCVAPESRAQHYTTSKASRYFFHQNSGFDVLAATKTAGATTRIVSANTYLAFGENAATAEIQSVTSSMESSEVENAFDHQLDDASDAVFTASDSESFVELKFTEPVNLKDLKIWSDQKFPSKFMVYLIPGEEQSPTASNIKEWKEDHWAWCICAEQKSQPIHFDEPYRVDLGGRSDRLVITWDKNECSTVSVREFEVGICPETPGSIAYAGQWLDQETGLYYQLNRYRLPELNGKFISPDTLGFADGVNFYAYAHNNPLSWHDPDGEFAHILIGAGIGALWGAGMYALDCWWNHHDFSWTGFAIATGAGTVSGGLATVTFGATAALGPVLSGVATGAVSGASYGFVSGFSQGLVEGEGLSASLQYGLGVAVRAGAIGSIGGGIGGAFLGTLPSGPPNLFTHLSVNTLSGTVSGAATGAAIGYWDTGTLEGTLSGAKAGALQGMMVGGISGLAMYAQNRHTYSKLSPEEKIYTDARLRNTQINGRPARIQKINPKIKDSNGLTNLQRMQNGQAPLDSNGIPIELHHKGQQPDGELIELTRLQHRGKGNDGILHPNQKASKVDHGIEWQRTTKAYWRTRAKMF